MKMIADPFEMKPEERFAELTGLLARGVLRSKELRQRSGETARSTANSCEVGGEPLDVPGETVLSVHTG